MQTVSYPYSSGSQHFKVSTEFAYRVYVHSVKKTTFDIRQAWAADTPDKAQYFHRFKSVCNIYVIHKTKSPV